MRGSARYRNETGYRAAPSKLYLSTIYAKRYIEYGNERIPVCGPGTRALFRVATDNKVHSLHYRWRKASKATTGQLGVPLLKIQTVNDTLSRQLSSSQGQGNLTSLTLCYYDDGGISNSLYPVYEYVWTRTRIKEKGVIPEPILGYTAASPSSSPAATPAAPAPSSTTAVSTAPDDTPPADDTTSTTTNTTTTTSALVPVQTSTPSSTETSTPKSKRSQLGTVTYGMYIGKGDANSKMWVHAANLFMRGWIEAAFFSIFTFSGYYEAVRKQYFWSRNAQFTTDNARYLDSVDVAWSHGHANFHHDYYASDNWTSAQEIGDPGRGNGLGRNTLRYWYARGCEFIPVPDDYYYVNQSHNAWDPWWGVFRGLHSVLSFRTLSYPGDELSSQWSYSAGAGFSTGSSWLYGNEEAGVYTSAPRRSWTRWTTDSGDGYFDERLLEDQGPGRWVEIEDRDGQPSVMTVCGHVDDSLASLERLPEDTQCLEAWYYIDARFKLCRMVHVEGEIGCPFPWGLCLPIELSYDMPVCEYVDRVPEAL